MKVEIERKFLVQPSRLPVSLFQRWEKLSQGYLSRVPVVRVRWVELPEGTEGATAGGPGSEKGRGPSLTHSKGYLTIKGQGLIARNEFEYAIPAADAQALLAMCGHRLEKTRYFWPAGKHVWEVDRFHGRLEGLWIAEIELGAEDEAFERPDWLGPEVTGDSRYANANLAETGEPPSR